MRSAGQVSVLGTDPETRRRAVAGAAGVVLQSWRDHGKWRVRELLRISAPTTRGTRREEIPRPWDIDELIGRSG